MFQRTATRLKRKLWWQNIKLWIILIVIILVILAVIISKWVGNNWKYALQPHTQPAWKEGAW